MRDLAAQRRASRARWLQLIDSTRDDLLLLVDAFVTEVAAIPVYGDGTVADAELRAAATASIDMVLSAVSGRTRTKEAQAVPIDLGRRRARANVPLEDLVAAVRLDFSVIWSDLLRRSTDDDAAVLALHAGDLWSVVDEYARAVQHSYLDERAAMAASARDAQRAYLAELVQPGGPSPSRIGRIATALGLDPAACFRVSVVAADQDREAYRAVQTGTQSGAPMFLVHRDDSLVIFWPAPTSDVGEELQSRLLTGVRGGIVHHVSGLAEIAAAAAAAALVLAALREDENTLHTMTDVWDRISRNHLDDAQPFSRTALDGLRALTPPERAILLGTVARYLDTGSISATAEVEFCHRNTVLNRLARFRELTGLDVTRPRQAALVVVLLS